MKRIAPSIVLEDSIHRSASIGRGDMRRVGTAVGGADAPRQAPALSSPPVLSDVEVDDICAGLTQNAAKARYLRDVLKVPVRRKPNGRPLVSRSDWERSGMSQQQPLVSAGPKWSRSG